MCELPVAMLACARIGAVHNVVFAGFSSESLAQRLQDCKCAATQSRNPQQSARPQNPFMPMMRLPAQCTACLDTLRQVHP